MCIYKVTNLVNGKVYIGQTTKTIEQRWRKHISEAKYEESGKRKHNYFHNAIIKYGEDNFIIELIEEVNSKDELDKREDYWISYYDSTNKSKGYNLMSGGQSGIKSDETKSILSEKKKENWQDENLRLRMSNGLKKATEEWIKISEEQRVVFICESCGKEMLLPKWEANKRKYCSRKCSSKHVALNALLIANKRNLEETNKKDMLITEIVIQWSIQNCNLILNCPKNKITPTLQDMINKVYTSTGVKDLRSIARAVCKSKSKIELLKYLQDIVKIYAVPDQK